jgi:hypothetical protein
MLREIDEIPLSAMPTAIDTRGAVDEGSRRQRKRRARKKA